MAASAWHVYRLFTQALCNKLLDMNADAFKIALCGSGTNANDSELNGGTVYDPPRYSHLTNELSGNNYPSGGKSAGTGTWTGSAGTETFDVGNAKFGAYGGNLSPYVAVLYNDTGSEKYLIAWCYLDATPAVYTITENYTLTITIANVFSLT